MLLDTFIPFNSFSKKSSPKTLSNSGIWKQSNVASSRVVLSEKCSSDPFKKSHKYIIKIRPVFYVQKNNILYREEMFLGYQLGISD